MAKQHQDEDIDLSKRRWFTFAKPEVVAPAKAKHAVPRPPYAVDDNILARLCTECNACVTACPYELIHLRNGAPQISLDYASCDLCGKCSEACPTLALSAQLPSTGYTAHISDICDNRDSYCTNCADSCSHQALTWQDNAKPQIDPTHCVGCGECVSSCFIQAIQLVLNH